MVGLRIQGLVRAARIARADMRAGFDEEGREAFLKRIRRLVAHADEILDDNGYMVEHLPAPSRSALSDLRAIAALRAAALAPAGPSQPIRKPVQLKNVVRTLDTCLERLATGASDPAIARDARLEAQVAADAIAGLCADAGSDTAGLPAPSRRAYAMLRWLSDAAKGMRIAPAENTIDVSRILKWFEGDFERIGGVRMVLQRYGPRAAKPWLAEHAEDARLRFFKYDWGLNALPADAP